MTTLAACFRAELVKWRKNWPLVVAILAPLLQIVFLTLVTWYSDERVRVFKPGLRFWVELNALAWNLVVMPIAAALIAQLSWSTEAEARAWSHLMVQPMRLRNHYLVKVVSHLSLMLGAYVLLQALLPIGGWILTKNGFLLPWMGTFPWDRYAAFALYGLTALVPVVVFQTWYSMRFPGLWGALAVVLVGTWACLQLIGRTLWFQALPWGLNAPMALALERLVPIPWFLLPGGLAASLVWVAIGVTGFRDARSPRSDV